MGHYTTLMHPLDLPVSLNGPFFPAQPRHLSALGNGKELCGKTMVALVHERGVHLRLAAKAVSSFMALMPLWRWNQSAGQLFT